MALLAWASAASADTLVVGQFRSAIEETTGCYRYVPTVRSTEAWGTRELRRMRDATRAARPGPGMPAAQDFANAFKAPALDAGAGAEGKGEPESGAPPVFGAAAPDAGAEPVFDVGLALPADVVTSEEYAQLLADVPESAVKFADYMIAYADGTIFLILNLKSVLANEVVVDWEALLRDEETLEGQHLRAAKARRRGTAEEEVESSSAATTRIVVRSTFRIIVGVSIGLLLWIIVRKL